MVQRGANIGVDQRVVGSDLQQHLVVSYFPALQGGFVWDDASGRYGSIRATW